MKIPTRNPKKLSDDEFVAKQLATTDAQALSVVPKSDEVVEAEMGLAPVVKHVQTPVESRLESINNLLSKAYEKASQLELTEKEIAELSADFDDSEFYRGANGNENLIYISHASLRARLNKVIGIGKWNVVIRRNWTEDFLTAKKEPASRVYVEGVLIVRGVFVAEAIGDGTYYKANSASNYGDAFEIAKSAVLRRLAKEFGVGLQAWSKDFAEKWKGKYKGFSRPEKLA